MIQLTLSEQELFDIIMSVYLAANAAPGSDAGEHELDTAARRKALLDKLHEAFDRGTAARQSCEAAALIGAAR
ncbi:MAG TPA: hypothetical protein VJ732_05360 [Bryobacteraceae bacterium]|nr:hypothetical protein [Bryobacteraceae bacterium]